MDLFCQSGGYSEGKYLKEQGISKVESHNYGWVYRARDIALNIAARSGEVCADDIRARIEPPTHPNAYGSIFRDKRFRFTGRRKISTAASRHAGEQRIWELA